MAALAVAADSSHANIGSARRHILVIPSEEYVPDREPLAGIFQKNHIEALRDNERYRFGVLSIRLQHSVPMYGKTLGYRLAGKKVDNELRHLDTASVVREFARRILRKGCINHDRVDGIDVIRSVGLYFLPPSPKTDHISWIAAGIAGFGRYCDAFGKPDLVHAHNALNAGLLAARISARYKIPYVLTEHSSYYHQRLVPSVLKPAIRRSIAKASRHSVVSGALSESLEKSLGAIERGSAVLPNVLPLDFEEQTVPDRGRRETEVQIICVGNLLPVKGQEYLLRAFARFYADHRNARLRLVGDGPSRPALERLARELAIHEAVDFLGALPRRRVREEMLSADLLVLPSLFETFGVVLIEAMACGLPIVATRCGGPDGIVGPETGLLVDIGDVEALRCGLSEMYSTIGSFDRSAIRARAISLYGKNAYSKRISDLYDAVLNA